MRRALEGVFSVVLYLIVLMIGFAGCFVAMAPGAPAPKLKRPSLVGSWSIRWPNCEVPACEGWDRCQCDACTLSIPIYYVTFYRDGFLTAQDGHGRWNPLKDAFERVTLEGRWSLSGDTLCISCCDMEDEFGQRQEPLVHEAKIILRPGRLTGRIGKAGGFRLKTYKPD